MDLWAPEIWLENYILLTLLPTDSVKKNNRIHILCYNVRKTNKQKKNTSANLQLLELPLPIPFEETSEQACHVK